MSKKMEKLNSNLTLKPISEVTGMGAEESIFDIESLLV